MFITIKYYVHVYNDNNNNNNNNNNIICKAPFGHNVSVTREKPSQYKDKYTVSM